MAKIVELDEKVALKEKMEAADVEAEEAERDAYFTRLKNDAGFQKYVVEEILRKNIALVGNLDTIPLDDDLEKMGRLVVINAAVRTTLQAILTRVL